MFKKKKVEPVSKPSNSEPSNVDFSGNVTIISEESEAPERVEFNSDGTIPASIYHELSQMQRRGNHRIRIFASR